jgi:hypothetical protein
VSGDSFSVRFNKAGHNIVSILESHLILNGRGFQLQLEGFYFCEALSVLTQIADGLFLRKNLLRIAGLGLLKLRLQPLYLCL